MEQVHLGICDLSELQRGLDHTLHSRVSYDVSRFSMTTPLARFMGPTWGPSGADGTQVGPMLAPWALLSGYVWWDQIISFKMIIPSLTDDSILAKIP